MIKKYVLIGLVGLGLAFGSYGAAAQIIGNDDTDLEKKLDADNQGTTGIQSTPPGDVVQSTLFTEDGLRVGYATFRRAPHGVLISLNIIKILPGWHGVHIHEKGDCTGTYMEHFKSAGGYYGGTGQEHGLLNSRGPQTGDLPNLWINDNKTGKAEFYSDSFMLDELAKDKGTSIIIDALPDDHLTQPAGGSGDKIACGVIRKAIAAKSE